MASALPQGENIGMLEISEKKREFDELVMARGVEFRRKVNEKKELDIQLIRLKHYLTLGSSKPLPTGAFIRLQNNQIWETVLEYLTNSCDIDSAQRTCPTFEDILLGKTPTANPKEREVTAVLKIMKKEKFLKVPISRWYSRNHGPWHLRLVSKSWQRATDHAFFKEFEGEWHLEMNWENKGRWWKDDINISTLSAIVDVERAWSALENSNARSSLLQIVRVEEHFINQRGIFYPKILEFLDEHGEHVKGLIVEWKGRGTSWAGKYLNLLSLVLRMPNLKALKIQPNFTPCYSPEEDVKDLKAVMLGHHFPQCSSLEVLSVEDCYELFEQIVAHIISKCNRLKSVYLSKLELETEMTRALEERNIQFIDSTHHLYNKLLPWASQFQLTKIVLGYYHYEPNSDFISLVNLFGKTLKYLELPINYMFIGAPVTFQLPKLKHLIIRSCVGLTTLDFLIPLQSLEHLEFVYNVYYEKSKNPEDKFHLIELKDFAALEKSNIWRCFPHLRIVKVKVLQNVDGQPKDYYDEEIWMDYLADEYTCQRETSYVYFKRGDGITKKFKSIITAEAVEEEEEEEGED